MTTQPTIYIPHGGGPCFFMDQPPGVPADTWDGMAAYLRSIAADVGERPKALLIISAHWELEQATVTAAQQPGLLFDYYGFPEHTYRLTYPAPGSPALAARVRALLDAAGIPNHADAQRDFDHGVFIPFKLIYPDADIPIVQLSLLKSLDAQAHIQLGRALTPLRDEGVLIVGSGMSYHNLREFFNSAANAVQSSERFDAWLTSAVTSPDTDARTRALNEWRSAPDALACHPRAEHLIPLMVTAGAALNDVGRCVYKDRVFGKVVSGFRFG
jgi:aromatic ring-opening dioxygenase catalytic subunit (LigB family)